MAISKEWLASFTLLLLVMVGGIVQRTSAATCVQGQNCRLPDCFCPTLEHPLGSQNIPQIVYFGFDDAVQPQVSSYYKELFTEDRKNPNGCPITMSLYVSNEYTLYEMVKEFYNEGMEIGVHSVTHQDINTAAKLEKEASEQKQNIISKAKIPATEVLGRRSPNLVTAGDDQPRVLAQLNYTYDISLTYSTDDNYPFPFTLDYGYPYPCPIQPCPSSSSTHKGFWEVMIHALRDPETGLVCGYVDSCRPNGEDAALEYLWSNFLKVYENTRAPFGMNMHAAWFATPEYMMATHRFIEQLLETPDVYIVNVHQMLQWMQNPVPLPQVKNFAPWGCGRASETATKIEAAAPQPSIRKPSTTAIPAPSPTEKQTRDVVKQNEPASERSRNDEINSSRLNAIPFLNRYRRPSQLNAQRMQERPVRPTRPSTERTNVEKSPILQNLLRERSDLRKVNASDCVQGINCILPHCFCRSDSPPQNRAAQDVPQIVYLAIDSPVDGRTFASFTQLFSNSRKNPNECPISGTIFMPSSGNYPPYVDVLKAKGLRLGVRGVTYSEHLDGDTMKLRIQEEISSASYQVTDAYGWRGFASLAPTDNIFQSLKANQVAFDSSVITSKTDFLWPYTLDFGLLDKCVVMPSHCPSGRYPGLWEVPVKPLYLHEQDKSCAFPDACPHDMDTQEDVYEMLMTNFQRHYGENRAPFGINLHSTWFTGRHQQEKLQGLIRFIDDILKSNDNVFVVSVEQMLDWIKFPRQNVHQFPC